VGGQGWISGAQALAYEIAFGNDPTATAPAQQVIVTQPLGTNVNSSSLGLLGITLPNGTGGTSVLVPVPQGSLNPAVGRNEFTTRVDLPPTQSLLVNVDAKLNTSTKTLTWNPRVHRSGYWATAAAGFPGWLPSAGVRRQRLIFS
jgi:hypothetical protein